MDNFSEIPLLRGLPEQAQRRFAPSCSWREYAENELVIDIEDETTDVRFVITGSVRVIARVAAGKEVILGEIREGSFFGEISAIDNSPRSANVTTLTRSRICTMPAPVFLSILREYPEIALKIMQLLAGIIRSLNNRLAEYSFLSAKHRLYAELLRLSRPRSGSDSQRIISPPPIQRELAERIGSRREVVSREINSIKREGVIEVTRGGIVIARPEELHRRISDGWGE